MRVLFALLFALTAFANAERCYFMPPSGWEIAHLKNPSPYVKIGFIGKGSTEFRPVINLATEEVDVPLKEYVKAVKEVHLEDPGMKWRDLGKFVMQGGTGRLIEITNSSPWGELKILQAILIQGDTAYILTASVLKEDFLTLQEDIVNSFKSLNTIPELWTPISDAAKREEFKELLASLGKSEEKNEEWEIFQGQVGSLAQLGPYWQFLALNEGHRRIFE